VIILLGVVFEMSRLRFVSSAKIITNRRSPEVYVGVVKMIFVDMLLKRVRVGEGSLAVPALMYFVVIEHCFIYLK